MEAKVKELDIHMKTLEKALGSLEEIMGEPYSIIVRDATIQRFEYTFELAWKLLRKVGRIEGLEAVSPRQAIRSAHELGLLEDIDIWFEMVEDRNRTSHTYNEETAGEVFESATRLPSSLRPVMMKIRDRYLEEAEETQPCD